MAQTKPHGDQLDIQDIANDISVDATASNSIATGIINDAGTGALDVFSASKIISDLALKPDAKIVEATVQTTDATITTVNSISVTTETVITFQAYVNGIETATGDVYSTIISGTVKNIAGITSIVGSVVVGLTNNDAGASTWVVDILADDTTDALDIDVTGEVAKTIDWVTRVDYIVT